jgi:hypothetical protein
MDPIRGLDRGTLDERGVALPLALFGLVAVSLLVTSALVTSTTELALSNAHQDGTRGLYAADAALEGFVAQRSGMQLDTHLRLATGAFEIAVQPNVVYNLSVAELSQSLTEMTDGSFLRRETYSLVAQPQSGRGRGVGALIEAVRTALPVSLNVDSGLTLGMNTTISGAAQISDGSTAGAQCDIGPADHAIRHSSNTTITTQGQGHTITGGIEQDERETEELMQFVLNDFTLEDFSKMASIRFGPLFDRPSFQNSSGPKWDAAQKDYRWGCPAHLVSGCNAEQAAHFPVVAIDAEGGMVDITGDHGQGILIIRNGGVHIRGNFFYQGIVLVEGALKVTGTPLLEGAVIAMGSEALIETDSELSSGSSLIRYNACEIANAQRGLTIQSLDLEEQTIDTPTFAWYEVLR